MKSYVISTDSSADLSEAYLKEHQITMISLSCILNGKIYNSENPITPKQLYDNIREGAMPTTSQVNPEQAKAAFEPLLKEGKDYSASGIFFRLKRKLSECPDRSGRAAG